MALEYFGAQAAEDAPADTVMGDAEWDTHAWQTRYAASLAIERQLTEHDWHVLLTASMDLQTFDRDPAAYLYERGASSPSLNTEGTQANMRVILEDLVSWAIDLTYNNSAA